MIDWDGDGNPFSPLDIALNDTIFNEPERRRQRQAEEDARKRREEEEEEKKRRERK